MIFQEEDFRQYLGEHGIAQTQAVARYARRCILKGVTTAEEVDDVFPTLGRNTRCRYRNAMRRYAEFQEACVRPAPLPEDEVQRFIVWALGRGFAASTIETWTGKIRRAYRSGATCADAVDDVFGRYSPGYRSNLRAALNTLDEFRVYERRVSQGAAA